MHKYNIKHILTQSEENFVYSETKNLGKQNKHPPVNYFKEQISADVNNNTYIAE